MIVDLAEVEALRAQVPPEVFTTEWKNAEYKAQGDERRHLSAAAKLLGISFRALRYRMQRLGIG